MDLITLLCLKWTTNKDLLYSTGNSAQCYVAAWIKVRFGREWTYMYTYGWVPSLFTWNCQNIVNWLCAESLQSCMTLCNPMDCSPLGSSVHGILQARTLQLVAISSSTGSSQPRDRTQVSYVSCFGRQVIFSTRTTWEAHMAVHWLYYLHFTNKGLRHRMLSNLVKVRWLFE